MASAVSSLLGSSTPSGATPGIVTSPAPSEQMFLQLLVSQLKNQDPLNPTDSSQFVSQLAQFSELQNVIGIRTDLESALGKSTAATNGTAGTNGAGTNGTGTNGANGSNGAGNGNSGTQGAS